MEFLRLAETLDRVSNASKRKEKVAIVSSFLRDVGQTEIESVSLFLAGKVFSESSARTLNISWRGLLGALKELIVFNDSELSQYYKGDAGEAIAALLQAKEHARQSILFHDVLTIKRVNSVFMKIADVSGPGSYKEKQSLIKNLLADASPREARYLTALILNDMRTGLSEGLLIDCIAEAFSINSNLVRRAWGFTGNIGYIARTLAEGGERALKKIGVQIMTPLKPMLANLINDLETVLASGPIALELKLDGARVQIHKLKDDIRIFSRGLIDVTESMPDIVEVIKGKIMIEQVVLDGEVVAVAENGTPFPFQRVMRRFGRSQDIERINKEIKLELYLFDILFMDNKMIMDRSYNERRSLLEKSVPNELIVENLVTQNPKEATAFFNKAREKGHEGVMAKRLDSTYSVGIRGKNWLKVKHNLETLDLVIIAAERGHGRRSNWYSDFYLAIRDEDSNDFVMIGKTFKGLTDDEFKTMTKKLERIMISKSRGIIRVKPEIVVEVLASEIQKSSRYKSGLALRFARIANIRSDKGIQDVTSLRELQNLYDSQFKFKAR